MADRTILNGSVLLYTDHNTENGVEYDNKTELCISRIDSDETTDSGTETDLARIKMFGSGKTGFQGVIAFETINEELSGGPERMRIHTNGNVGIGTPTPKNRLDVKGGAVIGASYSGTRTTPTNGLLVQGNVGIGTPAEPKAKLEVSGGAIMPAAGQSESAGILFPKDPGGGSGDAAWIRYYPRKGEATTFEIGTSNDKDDHIALMASGNVGIGTTVPTHKFHVKTGDAVGLFESTGSQAYLRLSAKEGLSRRVEFTNRPGGRASIWVSEAGDAFNVLRNGNVGIGATSPNRKLEIKRNGNNTEFSLNENLFLDGAGSTVRLTNNAYVYNGSWAIKDSKKKAFTLEVRDSGQLELYGTKTNGKTDWRKMATFDAPNNRVIFPIGNVGIGTTKPGEKLDVNGNINYNRLKKLDVADNFTAYVRAADFRLGHSSRRGSPGRALVDIGKTLELNFGNDWSDGIRYYGRLSKVSSRKFKDNITNLSSQEAFEALEKLNPVKFNLKADDEKMLHLGFIAEDAPDMVATPDKGAITNGHIVAVLTKIVKEQQKKITDFNKKMKILEEKLQYETTT